MTGWDACRKRMPGWEHTGSSGALLGAKSSEHAHALVIGKCIKVERGGEGGRGGEEGGDRCCSLRNKGALHVQYRTLRNAVPLTP